MSSWQPASFSQKVRLHNKSDGSLKVVIEPTAYVIQVPPRVAYTFVASTMDDKDCFEVSIGGEHVVLFEPARATQLTIYQQESKVLDLY